MRRIREHYKLLRKRIGKKKVEKGRQVTERIGNAESRKVEDRLHKIANAIVGDAADRNALIVLGDLGGIREDNDKGRYANDKIHPSRSTSSGLSSSTRPMKPVSRS